MKLKIKNLCVINSVYSLMLYMILIDPVGDKTFFVLGDGVCSDISNKLKHKIKFIKIPSNRFIKFIYLFIYYFLLTPILKSIFKVMQLTSYGHDHIYFSNLLIGEFRVIEDGLGNYITMGPPHSKLYQILSGIDRLVGYSNRATKIYLSGMTKIPHSLKEKSEIFNLQDSWSGLTESERVEILKVFGVEYECYSGDFLLITQPISEDGYVSEAEKIKIYSSIIKENHITKIVIKKHPRDKTNYCFDNVSVIHMKKDFPLELISLIGVSFKCVITLYSSSIFLIKSENKIIYGTENFCHKNNKLPLITKDEILMML